MILSQSQRIGAAVLFGIAFVAWVTYAVWPSRQPDLSHLNTPPASKHYRSWEERKDSMRRADSIRYAEWSAEREQRYDSFRIADSLRRQERRAELKQLRDSARVADSLWRDSMGIRYTRHEKRDTILDLNHCDTTSLQLLRGVGRYTALQIVRYREQLGGYYSPLQLTDEPFAKCHLDTLLGCFIVDTAAIERIDVNFCRRPAATSVYPLPASQSDLFPSPRTCPTLFHRRAPIPPGTDRRGPKPPLSVLEI